jgi:chloramphenicol-sensitive protein RarD|tara:strand:- start:12 stop:884 length:873 start_codon:yes stop_codon:yes gene_type:complete
MTKFNKGIIYASLGSFWWGVIGVLYFKFISYVNPFEVVSHRVLWTVFSLLITILISGKLKLLLATFEDKKKIILLFFSGLLIFINWSVWIYAISINQLVEASFGYYIFPILSVFFGNIFLKEVLNFRKKLSILIIFLSIIYMMFFLENIPWIGLIVALSFSGYAVLRKLIEIETDIGLLIESLFLIPITILIFYNLNLSNDISFSLSDISLSLILILAGPMTVIPLFLFVKGSELSALGPASMIFFIAPTGQFLLGLFLYDEPFLMNKLIGFVLIWIAVLIYLRDLYEKN